MNLQTIKRTFRSLRLDNSFRLGEVRTEIIKKLDKDFLESGSNE